MVHRVRLGVSYRASEWFEMFAGGSHTFAGKNVAKESDISGGVLIKF